MLRLRCGSQVQSTELQRRDCSRRYPVDSLRSPFGLRMAVCLRCASILSKIVFGFRPNQRSIPTLFPEERAAPGTTSLSLSLKPRLVMWFNLCYATSMLIAPTATKPAGHAPRWAIVSAFAVVYLGYGLNFLAVKIGVETLPAFLFAGTHVSLAGILLLTFHSLRSRSFLLSRAGMGRAAAAAFFLFVGGVGLVTEGEKLGVPSGMAAIIKASVPLWVATLEVVRPGGERLGKVAFSGLVCGAAGVVWLVLPQFAHHKTASAEPLGIGFLILSAFLFAVGTLLVRHRPPSASPIANSAWMMVLGGMFLLAIGLCLGEAAEVSPSDFTRPVLAAFLFLLFVHSLAAFSAMNWLLGHLPAAVVTTKFYVSPAIAVLAGWLVLGESVHTRTFASLALILVGVGVTLWAQSRTKPGH